jgi:CRP/FNR family cyclic AMP-dependent transcriptional regulator
LDLFWSLPDSRDFAGLSGPLDDLFRVAQIRKGEAGASLSDPDAAPERAFRCISGTIKVTKLLVSGREILITILQAGSIWSDRAVLNGYWKGVFVEAMEPTEVMSIEAVAFEQVVRSSPDLLAQFMLRISEQISGSLTLLDDFHGRDVASRLARILVRFSKQYGVPTESGVRIELPVTHQDLANMIGTARETVSRNMALFRQQGYVSDGHAATLEILNLDSLEKLMA